MSSAVSLQTQPINSLSLQPSVEAPTSKEIPENELLETRLPAVIENLIFAYAGDPRLKNPPGAFQGIFQAYTQQGETHELLSRMIVEIPQDISANDFQGRVMSVYNGVVRYVQELQKRSNDSRQNRTKRLEEDMHREVEKVRASSVTSLSVLPFVEIVEDFDLIVFFHRIIFDNLQRLGCEIFDYEAIFEANVLKGEGYGVELSKCFNAAAFKKLSLSEKAAGVRDWMKGAPEAFASQKLLASVRRIIVNGQPISRVPPEMRFLPSLNTLVLSNCSFRKIPEWIGDLSVEELDVYNNQLSELPQSMSKMSSLSRLFLEGNRLIQLPNLGSLQELSSLQLPKNRLTALPKWIANLHKLECLQIYGNPIRLLPDWLCGLPLKQLAIGENQFGPEAEPIIKKLEAQGCTVYRERNDDR